MIKVVKQPIRNKKSVLIALKQYFVRHSKSVARLDIWKMGEECL